jgi:hypothetical protein
VAERVLGGSALADDDDDHTPDVASGDLFERGRPDALLARRVRATRTGLNLAEGLPYEVWQRVGLQVGVLVDSSAWWIGDWLLYGQRTYGDRYATAAAATGFSYQTLRNYAWVASRFPMSRRRDSLSFGHHAELAALDDEEQEAWLRRADLRGWSRNELRRNVRKARDAGRSLPGGPVSIALRVEDPRYERWQAAAEAEGRVLLEWMTAALDEAALSALARPALDIAS